MNIEINTLGSINQSCWSNMCSCLNDVVRIAYKAGMLADMQVHNMSPQSGFGTAVNRSAPVFRGSFDTVEAAFKMPIGIGPIDAPVDEFFNFSTCGLTAAIERAELQVIVLAWLMVVSEIVIPLSVSTDDVLPPVRRRAIEIARMIFPDALIPEWLSVGSSSHTQSSIDRPDAMDFRT